MTKGTKAPFCQFCPFCPGLVTSKETPAVTVSSSYATDSGPQNQPHDGSAHQVSTTEDISGSSLLLLTVEQAAKRLGIGRTTCYALVSSGEIESVPVGRLRRIPAECLSDYVNRLREMSRTTLTAA
jgi:excisionase family DNA binding protein